jgi:hypothetical protein
VLPTRSFGLAPPFSIFSFLDVWALWGLVWSGSPGSWPAVLEVVIVVPLGALAQGGLEGFFPEPNP